MFADQKASIASALPSGFSLSDVPGLAAVGSAVRTAAGGVQESGSSIMRWLLPIAGLAAAGLLVWWLSQPTSAPAPDIQAPGTIRSQSPDTHPALVPEPVKRVLPDVSKFSTELTDTFGKLTGALAGVKDAATAEAALPKLQEFEGKLDVAQTTTDKLEDAGKATIKALVKSTQDKLKEIVQRVLAIPGVGEKFKTVVESIMAKLTNLAG